MMERVGELEYPERDELHLVDVLQALGDPVRLQIVRILDQAGGAIACNEMGLPVAKSTGSHHLKVLREVGVVRSQVDGLAATTRCVATTWKLGSQACSTASYRPVRATGPNGCEASGDQICLANSGTEVVKRHHFWRRAVPCDGDIEPQLTARYLPDQRAPRSTWAAICVETAARMDTFRCPSSRGSADCSSGSCD